MKQVIAALFVLCLVCPKGTEAQIVVTNDISCNGNANGALEVNAVFGIPPYTYVWNTGAVTDSIFNLATGTYSVTVTDGAFTTTVFTHTLLNPLPLQVTCVSTSVSCFGGNDGTATANAAGGTGVLSYLWSNGAITPSITNLSAGNYSVTITDANLCSITSFVIVTQPLAPVQATLVQTNVSCFGGSDGTATITNASGGSGILTYLWSNGATTSQITNLIIGNYSVTITDANACTFLGSLTITQPVAALAVTLATQTNVLCRGASTGAINVNVNGGTIPYLYNWSDGAVSQDITNVPASIYTLVVEDANGCTATINRTITQPATAVQVSLTFNNVTCNGGSDGTATATASGGTGAPNYVWSTGALTPAIINLTAGTYSVTATDANGCTATASCTITQPATPVQVFPLWDNMTCNGGNDGSINVIAVGGTWPLTYLWSTGANTPIITNLTAGNYSVTVTDSNACSVITNIIITEPAPVSVSFMTTVATCNGWNDATATATGTGGTGVMHYLWDTGEITPTITNLAASNHAVTVTDASGCSIVGNVVITQPIPISISPTITPSACDGQNTGAISIAPAGGTPAYMFSWHELNFDSTYTSQNLVNVRGGTYALTITDANGCIYLDTIVVPNLATVATTMNPVTYVCNGSQGSVGINALLADSLYYFTYAWNTPYNTGSFTTNDSVFTSSPSFIAGAYTITVTDNQTGCAAYYDFVISQSAAPLVVNSVVTHNLCYEDSNGSIQLSASGGDPKPGYHVTWNGPNGFTSTAFSINGLAVGDYMYTVSDDSVCSVSGTIRILPLMPLQGHVRSDNVVCSGEATGSAEAFYSGGIGPLSYSWSNGASTPFISNIAIGTYTLTITDSVGCSITTPVVITQPPAITITFDSLDNVSCYGETDGGIWLTTNSGTGNLIYNWLHDGDLFSQVTEDITNIPAGAYQVTAMDSLGCFVMANFTITQPAQTTFTDSIHLISCNNGSDGYWQIMPFGIDTPYIAIFSTGDTISTDTVPAPFIAGLSAGNYSVTFTSILACTWTFNLVLAQPLPITVGVADIVPVVCKGDSTGSITLDDVHGGTPDYIYLWSNGSSANPLTTIFAGIYNLTITDALGCNIYETYEVHEPYEWIKYFPTVHATSCQQAEDGEVTLYTDDIYWSPFNNSFLLYDSLGVLVDSVPPGQAIGNLPPGLYHTTLISDSGCVATDSLYVGKGPDDCILIPNLVTVNADGYNDVFGVQGGCDYDEFEVKIFTDNGVQVFESTDCLFSWDPTDNQAAANTVYYYYIRVSENGKEYIFKSSINIQK